MGPKWPRGGSGNITSRGSMSAHSPLMGGAAPLGFAARVRLNVDLPILRKSRRRPEIAYSWFPLPTAPAPHLPRTVDALARAIHDGLGLKCGSHRDLLLRVDGYALAHDVDIAVVRDGDVVHVSAPTSLHGGPWPQSPSSALPNNELNPLNFVATPATAPPALAPRRLAPETMPQRADTEGKERSRSARRKALKRSRARAEKYGINPGGGDGREIPPPPPRYAAPPTKRSRLAPKDAPPARAARVIRPLSAGAHSLDPNGDLAANGGSLASWDERGWVPRPDDAALAAAQAQRQRAGSKSKRVDAAVDAARKKIGFDSKPDAETRASSSSDTSSSSSDSSSDSSDSEEETRKGPAGRENDDDDELVKKEWLSLVAAGDSSSAPSGLDIEPGGVEPGDVITYVLLGRKLRGTVEEVRPDFGGDGGGVRMSAAIVPYTEELRVRGLRFAAGLAARAAMGVKQIPAPPFEGIELNGTVTVALDVLNVTARLIGGPRLKGEPSTKGQPPLEGELSKGELSNQKPATTPAIEADLEDAEGSDPTEVREEKRWIDAARGRNDSGAWIPPPPAGDPPPAEGRGWTWEDLINDHAYDPYEQLGYDPHDTTPVRPVKPAVQLDRTYGIPVEMHAAAAAVRDGDDKDGGENRGVQVQSNGRKASRGGPGAPPTGAVVAQRWRQSGAAAAAAAAAGGGAAAGTAPAGINADGENQVHSEPERAPTPEPTPEPRVAAAPPPKSPARGKGKGKEKDTRCPEQRALEVVLKRSMEEWRKSLPKGRRDLLTKDLAGKPGSAAKDFHLVAIIHKFHWDKDTCAKRRDVVTELNTLWKSFQVYHQQ